MILRWRRGKLDELQENYDSEKNLFDTGYQRLIEEEDKRDRHLQNHEHCDCRWPKIKEFKRLLEGISRRGKWLRNEMDEIDRNITELEEKGKELLSRLVIKEAEGRFMCSYRRDRRIGEM
ncbi:hypothetical protein AAF712_005677 [Marasmius tenuissimus]|uniref:Uncharacterized protein n=1 Tax=Marasmius tenuissimus TaxID=585030 RepID=A0ABR3A1M8_9AGAR